MSVLTDAQDAVRELASETEPFAPILTGPLPTGNGISLTFGSGGVETTFLQKGQCYQLYMTLNAKHTDQKLLLSTLDTIHRALTQRKVYPRTDTYQITDISTVAAPTYIDREENEYYLYGSSLLVKLYYFKEE